MGTSHILSLIFSLSLSRVCLRSLSSSLSSIFLSCLLSSSLFSLSVCLSISQTVDGEVVMLSAHWEKRRAAVVELQEQLQQIPGFLTDLETCTNRIGECAPSLCLEFRFFTLLLKCVLSHSFSHGNSPDNAYTKCTLGG